MGLGLVVPVIVGVLLGVVLYLMHRSKRPDARMIFLVELLEGALPAEAPEDDFT